MYRSDHVRKIIPPPFVYKMDRIALPNGACIARNHRLLNDKLAVILNSHQSKMPSGSDAWVVDTVRSVRTLTDEGYRIVASVGMNTWELALWAIGENNGKAVIICPCSENESPEKVIDEISGEFLLDPNDHTWLVMPILPKNIGRKSWWDERDKIAFNIAEKLVPVSVREGGKFDGWLSGHRRANQVTDMRFRKNYTHREEKYSPENFGTVINDFKQWDYLTHWTRRSHGKWPGELSADYFRDLVSSESYPRSASDTLERIVFEKRLRASNVRISGGKSVVAFTELKPNEAVKLMTWRKRFVRPVFEPWGIAIKRDTAEKIGIKKVEYVKSGEKRGANPELTQGWGTGNWPREAEWRAIGDIDLSVIDPEQICLLVPNSDYAKRTENYRILPIFNIF
ncbi:MAG: hypothetical protein ABIC40_08220 [bacterium]